jgi:hypothetical protein
MHPALPHPSPPRTPPPHPSKVRLFLLNDGPGQAALARDPFSADGLKTVVEALFVPEAVRGMQPRREQGAGRAGRLRGAPRLSAARRLLRERELICAAPRRRSSPARRAPPTGVAPGV